MKRGFLSGSNLPSAGFPSHWEPAALPNHEDVIAGGMLKNEGHMRASRP